MIDPAVVLLGLINVWLIVAPEPALAPVIAPVLVPSVHAKVLATLAANVILGLVLLHIAEGFVLVMTGLGFTVTVIGYEAPTQLPVVEVGVTL